MRTPKIYIGLTLVAIVVLSILRVTVTNTISTNGVDLGKIQEEVKEYKKQNAILHQKVLEVSSLQYIASKAGELGYVDSKKQIVLSSPLPIALKR